MRSIADVIGPSAFPGVGSIAAGGMGDGGDDGDDRGLPKGPLPPDREDNWLDFFDDAGSVSDGRADSYSSSDKLWHPRDGQIIGLIDVESLRMSTG